MFTPLLGELDGLRMQTARFRRVAVHMHSPDSHDWGTGGDATRNARSRFDGDEGLAEFRTELEPHLDVVCITDHMKCGFATRLSRHSSQPVVLPGMEVNLRIEPLSFPRVHMLTILPEGSTESQFACLFATQQHIPKDDADRKGQEEVRDVTLRQWVELVKGQGGLCIAAHVESSQGVRLAFRQVARDVLKLFVPHPVTPKDEQEHDVPDTLKDYLFDSGIDGVEIHKTDDGKHYRWLSNQDGKFRSLPTLLTFDAHCCERFGHADRVTHIKMTSLGFTGLTNALRFSDTRIRFPQTLPAVPNPRLLGISIKGDDSSFFKDVTVALAENLNCVIGVRGSGKSTLIEALRYIFGYNRTLKDLGKGMAEGIKEMQRANLKGSIIRVAYRLASGEDRILQATFDEKSDYATKCFSVDGDQLEIADVEDCGYFPMRLFGWSELENLGRNATRQRDLLDRLIPALTSVEKKRRAVQQQISLNRGTIQKCLADLKATFAKSNNKISHYKEFLGDFNKLNTEDVRALFAELDLAKSKKKVLEQIGTNTDVQIEKFDNLRGITLRSDINDILSTSDELQEWWSKDEVVALGITEVEANVASLASQAVERLKAFRELLNVHIAKASAGLTAVEQKLQESLDQSDDDAMLRIADLRANAEKRLNEVTASRKQYLLQWTALETTLDERKKLCRDLVSTQNEMAGIRAQHNSQVETTLNRFLPNWMTVSIRFVPSGDKEEYAAKLPTVIPGRAVSAVARLRQIIAFHYNPVECAELILNKLYSTAIGKAVRSDSGTVTLSAEDLSDWSDKSYPFEHHEHADVTVVMDEGKRLDAVLNMQETPWDDFASILLDGDPVNEKSPGQRASAMLPLIALAEETPLVIDQPEDNLDKRLVGTVLMQVLAELKEKRQITVCTHDPNIVVGGDAEQVIVLKAEGHNSGIVEAHGSIDNDRIVKTVIELLEGGKEAFEARSRRYGLDGENVQLDRK
jgi:ABC-type cobalamin/Fe3+-siderophores transport system ATPase subunit